MNAINVFFSIFEKSSQYERKSRESFSTKSRRGASLTSAELVLSTQTSVCVYIYVCVFMCVCVWCMHAFTNWPCHVFLERLPRGLWDLIYYRKERERENRQFSVPVLPFKHEWFHSLNGRRRGGGGGDMNIREEGMEMEVCLRFWRNHVNVFIINITKKKVLCWTAATCRYLLLLLFYFIIF